MSDAARPGPRWQVAVAVMVLGTLLGVPLVARVVTAFGDSALADAHRTPVVLTEDLDRGRWVVFERTGTSRSAGPITQTESDAPRLTPESVQVSGPDGERLPVRYDEANETITQGSAVYTGVLIFDVPRDGRYGIDIDGDGQQVLLTPSIGETFRELGRPFAFAIVGGVVFLVGVTLLAVGLVRRRTGPITPDPSWNRPAAGWYPDPAGRGHRYWDGTTWTDHAAP